MVKKILRKELFPSLLKEYFSKETKTPINSYKSVTVNVNHHLLIFTPLLESL